MTATIIIFIVAAAFVLLGIAKLFGAKPLVEAFAALGLGAWPRRIIGLLEVLFGLVLGASTQLPMLTFFAAVPLFLIVLGAVAIHLVRPPVAQAIPAGVLGAGLVAAVIIQPMGLQVLMLPSADELPVALVAAETLESFEEGSFIESVTLEADGSLLVTQTLGLNFMNPDFTVATSALLRRSSDGEITPLIELEQGTVAGVTALGPDGTIYLTISGGTNGLWRYDGSDMGSLLAEAPEGSRWNGVTLGPDGQLYVADDQLGAVWRVDPETGDTENALMHELLAPRPFVSLAPGANGVEFDGQDLVVTVSDSAKLYRTSMDADGVFGPLVEIATGIPGDDMAIGLDGTVYVTSHPYNTVVAVAPDGTRTIIADESTGATGSTDLDLSADGHSLYLVTDGGMFTGARGAAGQLVRLDLP